MKKIVIAITILFISINIHAQKIDQLFNGYLSNMTQTGQGTTVENAITYNTFDFIGAFNNDLGQYDGSEASLLSSELFIAVTVDGSVYELKVSAISGGSILTGTVIDYSGELSALPSGAAAIYVKTPNKEYPASTAGLSVELREAIDNHFKLLLDNETGGGLSSINAINGLTDDDNLNDPTIKLGGSLIEDTEILGPFKFSVTSSKSVGVEDFVYNKISLNPGEDSGNLTLSTYNDSGYFTAVSLNPISLSIITPNINNYSAVDDQFLRLTDASSGAVEYSDIALNDLADVSESTANGRLVMQSTPANPQQSIIIGTNNNNGIPGIGNTISIGNNINNNPTPNISTNISNVISIGNNTMGDEALSAVNLVHIGSGAGASTRFTLNNTLVGGGSGNDIDDADNISAFGAYALSNLVSGEHVIGIGNNVLFSDISSNPVTILNNVVAIGDGIKTNANNESNFIVIGPNAIGKGSNTSVIGNLDIEETSIFGSLLFEDYGLGNKEATDLSKTPSQYIAGFADDGTIIEVDLSTVGGSSTLEDLTDMTFTGLTAGQFIQYDGTGWVNVDAPSDGAGGVLNDLTDVILSSSANGQVLTYDNGIWKNQDLPQSGIALTDLSATNNPAGVPGLTYDNTTGVFTYTPADLSAYLTSEVDGSVTNEIQTITGSNGVIATATGNDYDISLGGELSSPVIINTNNNTFAIRNSTSPTALLSVGTSDVTVKGSLYQYGNSVTLSDYGKGDKTGTLTYLAGFDNLGNIIDIDPSSIGGSGGIALTDLSVTTNSAGTAALSYNNTTGIFTYTPPDLSGYLTAEIDGSISNEGVLSASTSAAGTVVNITSNTNGGSSVSLTANTGLAVSSNGTNTIYLSNTAPDQTVTLTGTGTTDITGTYPDFTINSESSLEELTNVQISNPSLGQVLKYDGTKWINDVDATATGGSGTVLSVTANNGVKLTSTSTPEDVKIELGGTITDNISIVDFGASDFTIDLNGNIALSGGTITLGDATPSTTIVLPTYISGAKTATALSKTATGYVLGMADDGTVIEVDASSFGGSVGATILDELTDVQNAATASNGQVLKYNSGTSVWSPANDLVDDADADPNNEIQTMTATNGLSVSATGNDYEYRWGGNLSQATTVEGLDSYNILFDNLTSFTTNVVNDVRLNSESATYGNNSSLIFDDFTGASITNIGTTNQYTSSLNMLRTGELSLKQDRTYASEELSQGLTIAAADATLKLFSNSVTNSTSTSINLSPDEVKLITPNVFATTATTGQFLQLTDGATGTVEFATALTAEVDGSVTNEIQDLSLTGNTLSLSSDATTVDLSNYLDDQTVTLTGGGITAISGTYPNFTITSTEVDGSVTNEIQSLSLTGDNLSLSDGGTVSLPYLRKVLTGSTSVLIPDGGSLSFWNLNTGTTGITIDDNVNALTYYGSNIYNSYGSGTNTGTLAYLAGFTSTGSLIEVNPYSGSNGLNLSGSNLKLGGTISENTIISLNNNSLSLGQVSTDQTYMRFQESTGDVHLRGNINIKNKDGFLYGTGYSEASDFSFIKSDYLASFSTGGNLIEVKANDVFTSYIVAGSGYNYSGGQIPLTESIIVGDQFHGINSYVDANGRLIIEQGAHPIISTTTSTIDFENKAQSIVKYDLTSASSTTSLTLSGAVSGGIYTMHFINATGKTIDWPANAYDETGSVKANDTITAAGKMFTMYYDGTNYYIK